MNFLINRTCSRYSTGFAHRADKHLTLHTLRPPSMAPKKKTHQELLAPFFYEHQRMKQDAMVIDPVQVDNTPKKRESSFADPWKVVTVSDREIAALMTMNEEGFEEDEVYGIGPERAAINTHPYDLPSAQPSTKIQTKKPGEGAFTEVATGPYGQREFKYLYLVGRKGMDIVREMSPCPESSRGIPLHSLIKSFAVVGGEIFFDDEDPKTAYMNFGSARFPFRDAAEADKTARFVLSLGYEKIVAVYPDRDFSTVPYGMKERYGKALANAVYIRESL